MPKRIVPLSDVKIQKAKSKERNYSLFDGGGLFVLITHTGGKLWRFKYRFNHKQKLLAFGSYPEITLQDARKKREDARRELANNIDPGEVKKAQKKADAQEGDTFRVVAVEWYDTFKGTWTEKYSTKVLQCLENNVFPLVGKDPISSLESLDILKVLKFAEERGVLDTAHRIRSLCGQIFRYAVITGRVKADVTPALKGALPRVQKTSFPAITDPEEAGAFMRAVDGYHGSFIVQCALKLAPLFFVRPIELRTGEWTEVSFKNALWTIPRAKMKMRKVSDNDHCVPLCTQATEILKQLYRLTGSGKYIFPSGVGSGRPMSENAILTAIRRMGYEKEEMTGHGVRAMARTILDEVLHVRVDYIEHQLAHAVKDSNGRAYNRTTHLPERRKMMQQWADYLDEIKKAGQVLDFKARK